MNYIDCDDPKFQSAQLERLIAANQPFLISCNNETKDWRSRQEWVTESNGTPAFDYLKKTFGTAVVAVADCEERHYNAQKKTEMQLTNYIDYWTALIADNYDYTKHKCLYLKDWHLTRDFPTYRAYKIKDCFRSDWLNEFWDARTDSQDDYRFVYMGPKGSWTPLHTDVFNSFSWSANICGVKRWILFPPEQDINLRDARGNLPYDVTAPQMNDVTLHPRYGRVIGRLEVRQGPGQIIFVPSKWLHQVYNEEDTISVNHNWFNGCNIHFVWESLLAAHADVQKEISDCRGMDGWHRQCQVILKATYGMDFDEFLALLLTVLRLRIQSLSENHVFNNAAISGEPAPPASTEVEIEEWIRNFESITSKMDINTADRVSGQVFDLSKIQYALRVISSQLDGDWEDIFQLPRPLIERLEKSIADFLVRCVPVCVRSEERF